MKSLLAPARSPRHRRAALPTAALSRPNLAWIHDGIRHRVTVWPEVSFQTETAAGEWHATRVGDDAFASAALGVTPNQWRQYLEFVPAAEREFLLRFQFGRMAALHVLTRCPDLLAVLQEVPAIACFLTVHLSLRGGEEPRWAEINAVFDRDGVFGLLQWLGLPASRQTLRILGNIVDPDLPRRLIEPLRAALWEPEAIWALSHAATLSDEQLTEACDALAA
jgi:hypothetical protein